MMFQVSTNKAMSPKSLHHLFPKLVEYFGMPPSVFCCFRYILSFPLLSWVKMVVFQNHPCLRMASRRAAGRWIRFAFCAVTTLSLQVVHSVKQRLTRAWKMAKTWWSLKSAFWGVQYWQLSTHHFHLSVSLSMSSLRPTKDELCEKAVARIELADDTAIKRSIHSMTQVTWRHDSSVSFHLPNSHLWFQKKKHCLTVHPMSLVGWNTWLDLVHKSTSLALAKSRHGHHVLSSFSFLLGKTTALTQNFNEPFRHG